MIAAVIFSFLVINDASSIYKTVNSNNMHKSAKLKDIKPPPPPFKQQGSLFIASDGKELDHFGHTIVVNENNVFISSKSISDIENKVYINELKQHKQHGNTNTTAKSVAWFETNILHSAPATGFGNTIAAVDNFLFVGSPLDSPLKHLVNAGSVTIYKTNVQMPMPIQSLKSDKIKANFGCSISSYGNSLLIGASGEHASSGRAYLYQKESTSDTWTLRVELKPKPDVVATWSLFGHQVKITSTNIIISAPDLSDVAMLGAVYIYDLNDFLTKEEIRDEDGTADTNETSDASNGDDGSTSDAQPASSSDGDYWDSPDKLHNRKTTKIQSTTNSNNLDKFHLRPLSPQKSVAKSVVTAAKTKVDTVSRQVLSSENIQLHSSLQQQQHRAVTIIATDPAVTILQPSLFSEKYISRFGSNIYFTESLGLITAYDIENKSTCVYLYKKVYANNDDETHNPDSWRYESVFYPHSGTASFKFLTRSSSSYPKKDTLEGFGSTSLLIYDDKVIAIGAPGGYNDEESIAGKVYIYGYFQSKASSNQYVWKYIMTLKSYDDTTFSPTVLPNSILNNGYGHSLAIYKKSLLIGADTTTGKTNYSGAVYMENDFFSYFDNFTHGDKSKAEDNNTPVLRHQNDNFHFTTENLTMLLGLILPTILIGTVIAGRYIHASRVHARSSRSMNDAQNLIDSKTVSSSSSSSKSEKSTRKGIFSRKLKNSSIKTKGEYMAANTDQTSNMSAVNRSKEFIKRSRKDSSSKEDDKAIAFGISIMNNNTTPVFSETIPISPQEKKSRINTTVTTNNNKNNNTSFFSSFFGKRKQHISVPTDENEDEEDEEKDNRNTSSKNVKSLSTRTEKNSNDIHDEFEDEYIVGDDIETETVLSAEDKTDEIRKLRLQETVSPIEEEEEKKELEIEENAAAVALSTSLAIPTTAEWNTYNDNYLFQRYTSYSLNPPITSHKIEDDVNDEENSIFTNSGTGARSTTSSDDISIISKKGKLRSRIVSNMLQSVFSFTSNKPQRGTHKNEASYYTPSSLSNSTNSRSRSSSPRPITNNNYNIPSTTTSTYMENNDNNKSLKEPITNWPYLNQSEYQENNDEKNEDEGIRESIAL